MTADQLGLHIPETLTVYTPRGAVTAGWSPGIWAVCASRMGAYTTLPSSFKDTSDSAEWTARALEQVAAMAPKKGTT